MDRFARSWNLAKSSWSVIRSDRDLFALPIISGVASILVMISFAVPAWLSLKPAETHLAMTSLVPEDQLYTTVTTPSPTVWTYVIGALFYFVAAFVVIFFNSALIHGANERFEGGNPSLTSALNGAWSRVGLITQWAAVSSTVSMLFKQLQRGGPLGNIVGGVLGFAWAVVSYLVLPALIIDGVSVKDAFTHSKNAVRTTWGENLIGQAGIGTVSMLGTLPGIAMVIGGVFLLTSNPVAGIAVIAIGALTLLVTIVITTALGTVYQTALFRFATHRPVGDFSRRALVEAYQPKKPLKFMR